MATHLKMLPFHTFLGLVLLRIACPLVSGQSQIAYRLAFSESRLAPSKYATHRSHVIAHGRRLEAFYPLTTFHKFGDGIDPLPSFKFWPVTFEGMVVAVTQSQLGINSFNIRFQSGFSEVPDAFAYDRQFHVCRPSFHTYLPSWPCCKIVSFGSSFVEISYSSEYRCFWHSIP
ncbi:hypothetical protein BD779DRAFT_606960 [Infundibulicybe gibba]|nr:hypothetical protein BD779DRAFT_606960 [Infundibulicybe gibba]